MTKKATSKDYEVYRNWQEANNLSRYNTRDVPKKPVAVSGKKTVPEVLDWGSGIPKDYLAYLNKQEMALVQKARKYKGKRSYKGIPAYPDPGDTAAGDRGQGTSSSAGLGNNTGGGTTYGGGGGRDSGAYGGGGMGSYGGSTEGSRQGGGGGSTSSVGGGVGGGVGDTRSSTDSSTTASAGASNPQDNSAMQSAAENDAVRVARESPAFRADARSGGIGSIGVGPDNNKINISNPSESSISGALSRVSSATYRDVTPTSPGGGGMGGMNARRGSSTVAVGPSSGADASGNIATGSVSGVSQTQAQRMDRLQSDLDRYRLSQSYEQEAERRKAEEQQDLAERVAEMNRLASLPDWQFDEDRYKSLRAPPGPGIAQGGISDIKPESTFNKYDALKAYDSPYGPELSAMRGTAIEAQLVDEANRVAPSYEALRAYDSPYGPELSAMRGTAIEAQLVDEANKVATSDQPPAEDENEIIDLTQEAYLRSKYPHQSPRTRGIGSIPDTQIPGEEEGSVYDADGNVVDVENFPEETQPPTGVNPMQEGPLPPGVNPAQDVAVYPEPSWVQENILSRNRYTRALDKVATYLGKKEFDSLTDEEKNALAAKWVENNENLRRGDIPANRQDRIEPVMPDRPITPPPPPNGQGGQGDQGRGDQDSYGRPYKHYRWDLGMGIPSPGDPDYNEYRRYLRLRRSSYT